MLLQQSAQLLWVRVNQPRGMSAMRTTSERHVRYSNGIFTQRGGGVVKTTRVRTVWVKTDGTLPMMDMMINRNRAGAVGDMPIFFVSLSQSCGLKVAVQTANSALGRLSILTTHSRFCSVDALLKVGVKHSCN